MLLSEDSEPEKVIEYLTNLKDQVEAQQAEAQRINKYQKLFKVRKVHLLLFQLSAHGGSF
jgi:hypothetical protein